MATFHPDSTKPLLSTAENEDKSSNISGNQMVSWDDKDIKSRDEIEKRKTRILLTLWPLVLQTLLSILLAVVTLGFVDRGVFDSTSRKLEITQPDGSIGYPAFTLLQSDVTTAISACLTAIRFFGGLWTVGTVRRCVFILLVEEALTLGNIKWMLTWSLPARFKGRNTNATLLISFILLASFPSQFSSPLLTGSISWTPSRSLFPGEKQLGGISFSASGSSWEDYVISRYKNSDVIHREAAGISDLQWGIGRDSATNSMKRALPSAQNLPIGSTLHNITLPALIIQSLEWIKDPTLIPSEQTDFIFGASGPFFSPFHDPENPAVAIAPHPNGTWGPVVSDTTFPEPSQVFESRLLITLVDRVLGKPAPACLAHSNTKYYGTIPTNIGLFPSFAGTDTNCYAFANVTYSAGVIICHQCDISSFLVADSGNRTVTRDQLQDDSMVLEALGLAAKLTSYTISGNISVPSPINNIDNFARAVLSRSYQACWVALTNRFQPTSSELLSTDVNIALTSSVEAAVSRWRVYLWLFTNLLLALTGIISWYVQKSCSKPSVVDSEVAMLLLDSQNIHKNDRRQLHDLSILTPDDIAEVGLLRLEVDQLTHRRVLTSQKF